MLRIVKETHAARPHTIIEGRRQGEQRIACVQHTLLQRQRDDPHTVLFVVIGAKGGKIHFKGAGWTLSPKVEILCAEACAGMHPTSLRSLPATCPISAYCRAYRPNSW